MAEETNSPVPEADEAAASVEQPVESEGRSFLMILLPLLFVALSGGGWVAYSYYPSVVAMATTVGLDFSSDDSTDEATPVEYGQFTELQGLIVNPADSEGRRFLMVNIGLETPDESGLEQLKQKDIVVRDKILRTLSKHTISDLSDISIREQIKQELLNEINDVLQDSMIDRLYFTQYVLQ